MNKCKPVRLTVFSIDLTVFKIKYYIMNKSLGRFNPIPTGLCHVITLYGLIQPIASRNRVKSKVFSLCTCCCHNCYHKSRLSGLGGVEPPQLHIS